MRSALIDIGVNLADKQFHPDRDEVVQRALDSGVNTLILTGTSLPQSQAVLELAQHYAPHTYCTAGIHPHDANSANPNIIKELGQLLQQERVVAVGETGLDFNRDFSPRPQQEWCFEQQLELAANTGLPLFCHERDAADRMVEMIKAHRDSVSRVVIHCFTADKSALFRYLDLDCHIGLTGWICDERRGTHLLPLIKEIPANRLMIETDAPWLLPRTLALKPKDRRNEPMFLHEVVTTIAINTGKTYEQVAEETTACARDFFAIA